MKSVILPLLLVASMFAGCSKEKTESLSNQSNVIMYETVLSTDIARLEWVKNIDSKRMITSIFDRVKSGELNAYNPYGDLSTPIKWENVLFQMDALNDTIEEIDPQTNETTSKVVQHEMSLSEIQGIVFIEEWSQETGSGRIVKDVLGVAPVRYFNPGNGEEIRKSIVFVCYFTEKKPPLFEN